MISSERNKRCSPSGFFSRDSRGAGVAVPVDDDFVPLHAVALRKEVRNSAKATSQIKEALTLFAKEKVVMSSCRIFVVGLHTRNLNVAHLALFDHLLESPVNCGNADALHDPAGLVTNFLCG